jgi:hypothetical protein
MIEQREPSYIYNGENIKFYVVAPGLIAINYINPEIKPPDFKLAYKYLGYLELLDLIFISKKLGF